MDKKKLYRTTFLFIFLVALVGFACELPGLPGEGAPTGEPGLPTSPPEQPTEPPVEPTAPPVEPTTPPVVEPTDPGEEIVPPPESGGGDGSESLITVLFWLLVVVVVILGIALIVSLFTSRRKEPPAAAPTQDSTPSYAETGDATEGAQPVPTAPAVSVLDNMSPQVAPLYDRFVNLVQGLGPVTILPTQTRVDFQRRIIFASTQFSQEDLRVQLLLPQRVDDPRMVRIEVFSEDKVSHSLIIRTLEDFDAKFTSWLQEAYELGE